MLTDASLLAMHIISSHSDLHPSRFQCISVCQLGLLPSSILYNFDHPEWGKRTTGHTQLLVLGQLLVLDHRR